MTNSQSFLVRIALSTRGNPANAISRGDCEIELSMFVEFRRKVIVVAT
jgi:hypothetical protein